MTKPDIPRDLPERSSETYLPPDMRTVAATTIVDSISAAPEWKGSMEDDSVTVETQPSDPLRAADPSSEVSRSLAFALKRRVGVGGMGEVWSALQTNLARSVAVKRLLPRQSLPDDKTTQDVAALFELEAKVAGRLEHPNIVPIHDLGYDENGQPLIAMKLVEGNTWADIIASDLGTMSEPDFLGKHLPILISMTNAVAFAHDRGVVHRDLKPSQVMVGSYGETLLMDWGLAIAWKDTGRGDMPALTLPTSSNASNPAGTPALMAPEQTHRGAGDVGPHTDIFLLGGTLYYLLTGSYPYSASTSLASFMKAMAAEVERPEARVPDRWIPKELADLAMHALAVDPSARVESATKFRDELADWMTGAAHRREAQVLLDAAAESLDTNLPNYSDFDVVLHHIERARNLWPSAPEAPTLHLRAKGGYARIALAAHDLTLARAQAASMDECDERSDLLARIDAAAEAARRKDIQRRWAMRATTALLATVIVGGALFTYSLETSRRAELVARFESDRQRLIASGQRDRAGEARDEAEELVKFMLGDLVKRLELAGKLHVMETVLDRVNDLLAKRREKGLTVEERTSLVKLQLLVGHVRMAQGKLVEADAQISRAYDESKELLAIDPNSTLRHVENLETKMVLADVRGAQGRTPEARELYTQCRESLRELIASHPQEDPFRILMGNTANRFGRLLLRMGDADAALDVQREGLEQCIRLANAMPTEFRYQSDLAAAWGRMGAVYSAKGMIPEADRSFSLSLGIYGKLAIDDPETDLWKRDASLVRTEFGTSLWEQGRIEEALTMLQAVRSDMALLMMSDPTNLTWRAMLLDPLSSICVILEEQGKLDEAADVTESLLGNSEMLVALDPTNVHWRSTLGVALNRYGNILLAREKLDEALKAFERGRLVYEELSKQDPDNRNWRREIGVAWNRIGNTLTELKRWEESLAAFETGLVVSRDLAQSDPDNPERQRDVLVSWNWISSVHQSMGELQAAADACNKCLEIAESLAALEPETGPAHIDLGRIRHQLSGILLGLGRLEEAADQGEWGLAMAEMQAAAEPSSVDRRRNLTSSAMRVGIIRHDQGRFAEAREVFERGKSVIEDLIASGQSNAATLRNEGVVSARLGAVLIELGERDAAKPLLERGTAILEERGSPDDQELTKARAALDSLQRQPDAGIDAATSTSETTAE